MKARLVALTLVLAAPAALAAQDTIPLMVGATAPDFALTSASKDGVADAPVRLSDFRDQTVVIAFFYKARTKG
jgi:hypothetical protein